MTFSRTFLDETAELLEAIPEGDVEEVVRVVRATRDRGGRLFLCGSGGGAGHASHACCDFRKMNRLEAYCVSDNTSELTARINDDGWDQAYADWLRSSRLGQNDCLFVFSVGGGDEDRRVSTNLVEAMRLAKRVGASLVGVVGPRGGVLAQWADARIVVPDGQAGTMTAQTEGLQAVLWHLMVSHPALATDQPKWESLLP
jgi:D-sedoheptulose 7-phosphate isomerase